MNEKLRSRAVEMVWSVFASEVGLSIAAAKQERLAHYLRPALWSLQAGEPLDCWAIIDLPPRTFHTLLEADDILRRRETGAARGAAPSGSSAVM